MAMGDHGNRPESFTQGLATEQTNAASVEIDRMTPLQIVRIMNAEDADGGRGSCERVAVDCGGG